MYTRLEDERYGNEFYLRTSGNRELNILDYTTTYTRNTKTMKVSIVDYLEDERPELMAQDNDWTFNPDYEEEWEDSYWSGNLLLDIDIDLTDNEWYGRYTYWEEWVTDNPLA